MPAVCASVSVCLYPVVDALFLSAIGGCERGGGGGGGGGGGESGGGGGAGPRQGRLKLELPGKPLYFPPL